jgi:hypothetical protein
LVTSVGELNQYNVQLVHVAGFPGWVTIVISDGSENSSAEFFSLMRKIRAEVTQETVQVSPSRL